VRLCGCPRAGNCRRFLCKRRRRRRRHEKSHDCRAYYNGATVEKELPFEFEKTRMLGINLYQHDFTTSTHLAEVINGSIQNVEAKLVDSGSVTVRVKKNVDMSMVQLVALVENLDVPVDSTAVVVMSEKTVRLSWART